MEAVEQHQIGEGYMVTDEVNFITQIVIEFLQITKEDKLLNTLEWTLGLTKGWTTVFFWYEDGVLQ